MGMIINPYLVQPSGPSYGTLTTAWIAATGETDLTILGALNTLESDLTTYGLTSKMKALYPFVGGTSTKHSYNFMNTAAYQLTFNGGWTHSSTGALPNGTNAYANTGFNPSTVLSSTNGNIGVYLRTNNSGTYGDIGGSTSGARAYLATNWNGSTGYASYGSEFSFVATTSTGLYSLGRLSTQDSNVKIIRNGSTVVYNDNPAATSLPNNNTYLGAMNESGTATYFSNREQALAYMSDGLTNAEAANFYTAVQTFQTTLGRQVGVPIVSDADAQAFLNAAVITDTTQASAINTLVTGLKTDGLWTKMTALYPFVGGNATAHSYNLKNPATYQLTFNGGWTHSSTGSLPNGTNAYANTGILASSFGTDYMLSFYSRTNSDGLMSDLGTYNETNINATVEVLTRLAGSLYMDIPDVNNRQLLSNSDSRGNFLFFNNSSNGRRAFRNSTSLLNTTYFNASMTNKNLIFSDWGYLASARFSNRELAFGGFGSNFTATDATNYYNRIQTYQTTLSRNV